MAQRVHVILEDDIDGSEATETILFGVDGQEYEIDLSEAHAKGLRDAVAEYVIAARKVSASRRATGSRPDRRTTAATSSRAATAGDGPAPREVRAWAEANGIEVSSRGRIPSDVTAKFLEAK